MGKKQPHRITLGPSVSGGERGENVASSSARRIPSSSALLEALRAQAVVVEMGQKALGAQLKEIRKKEKEEEKRLAKE